MNAMKAGRVAKSGMVSFAHRCGIAGSTTRATVVASSARHVKRVFSSTPKDVMYLPMPKLSPSMTRGTVTKWLKAEGDEVNEYDVVLELTTESLYAPGEGPNEGAAVNMIVELAERGYVGKIFAAEGDTIEVGQAIMAMCEEEGNVKALGDADSPGVDFYGEGGGPSGPRVATYQGYLNKKTPEN